MLQQELIDLLICPNCRGGIEHRAENETIVCLGECRFEYPIVNDIPHMLINEARQPSNGSE